VSKKPPAKPLPERGCHNCRHWQQEKEPGSSEIGGSCRRYPPSPLYDPDEGLFMAWPWTPPEEHCGEHLAKLQ
jgi:hypothetical protein